MSWQRIKLGEFLKVRENRFKPNDRIIKGLKRVDKIDFKGALHLSDTSSKTDMILVKKGDLLISGINVAKGAVIVYEGDEDIVATIHYSSYEVDKKQIDIEFLKLFLKSPEFLDAIKEQVPGGIKTEIKPKHFLPLEIDIPTKLSEQSNIVEYFSLFRMKATALTIELTSQLSLLKQLRLAFLREAMQGKLVSQDPTDEPARELIKKIKAEKEYLIKEKKIKKEKELTPIKADEIPFEIPSSWVWCNLGDVTEVYGGLTLGRKYSGPLQDVPYLRVANVQRGFIDTTKMKYLKLPKEIITDYLLHEDDILVNEGGDFDKVGRCAIWDSRIDPCIHQNHLFKVRSKNVLPKFIEYCINSNSSRVYFLGNYKRSTNLASINRTKLLSLPIALPPLLEQHRIVARLEHFISFCRELEQKIEQSQAQSERLLQQVLREALNPKKEVRTHHGINILVES